jgi:hypothetical protein
MGAHFCLASFQHAAASERDKLESEPRLPANKMAIWKLAPQFDAWFAAACWEQDWDTTR